MNKTYSVQHSNKTVFATCNKTWALCLLNRLFTPLPNIRVLNGQAPGHKFQCSIILRGTPQEIKQAMPIALDLTDQTCRQCQAMHLVKPVKTR